MVEREGFSLARSEGVRQAALIAVCSYSLERCLSVPFGADKRQRPTLGLSDGRGARAYSRLRLRHFSNTGGPLPARVMPREPRAQVGGQVMLCKKVSNLSPL